MLYQRIDAPRLDRAAVEIEAEKLGARYAVLMLGAVSSYFAVIVAAKFIGG